MNRFNNAYTKDKRKQIIEGFKEAVKAAQYEDSDTESAITQASYEPPMELSKYAEPIMYKSTPTTYVDQYGNLQRGGDIIRAIPNERMMEELYPWGLPWEESDNEQCTCIDEGKQKKFEPQKTIMLQAMRRKSGRRLPTKAEQDKLKQIYGRKAITVGATDFASLRVGKQKIQ